MSEAEKIEEGRTYSSADVARLVFHKTGRRVDWFYENKDRLMKKEGFPRPISRFGWPKWSGKALLAWLDRPQCGPAEQAAGRNVVDFSAALRERGRQVAQRA